MVISSTKIWFSDFAYTIRLILAKLLQGFLAEIPTRIAAHPAGTRGRRIDHLSAKLWVFVCLRKIAAPMKTTIAPQSIPVMPAVRPGQFAASIRHGSILQAAPQPSPDGSQGGRPIAWRIRCGIQINFFPYFLLLVKHCGGPGEFRNPDPTVMSRPLCL